MAVVLTWALFLGWTAVGLAALNAAGPRGPARKLMFAPALGAAALGVLAHTGIKLGLPVGRTAPAIGAAGALVALAVLWRTRTTRARALVAARRQAAFAGALVAAFALVAWPLFKFGFDWVANGNDDFANYCLGATGFRDHGYLSEPTADQLLAQQDPTLPLWYLYFDGSSPREMRTGSELTLALVSAWTGLTPQQAFMPVLVAFHLALVSATAGLVLAFARRRGVAVGAALLLAVSSQATYAVVQQLIAQAIGLALLCVALALLRLPVRALPRAAVARRAAACGLACAGLILFYPEVVPFFVGAAVLLGVRDLVRRRPVAMHLWHAAAAVAVMALLLPVYLVGTVRFMADQAAHGARGDTNLKELFPYYFTPRGPALVPGLLPMYANLPEPLHSAVLVCGLAAVGALAVCAVQQFRRGHPFGAVLVVTLALGAALYYKGAGFGLFKLVMFAQPFLWAAVAAWAVRARRGAALAAGAVLLGVAALNARTQAWYVRQSTGHDSRVDLPAATQKRVIRAFRAALADPARPTDRVLIATENHVLQKLLAAEAGERPSAQLAMAPFFRLRGPGTEGDDDEARAFGALVVDPAAAALPVVRDPDTGAPLHALAHVPADWTSDRPERVLLVAGAGPLSVLNRQRHPEAGAALVCEPLAAVRNFAAFRDAAGARQSFMGMRTITEIALHRLEPDPALRHRTFAGVGRAVVLDVLNPTPRVRAVVSYTATYLPDPDARAVPPVRVVGAARVPLAGVGAGAARLVSPPLAPQPVGRSNVLVLEIDKPPVRNPNRIKGVEALWGADVPRDRRHITGHLRELSVISEDDYAAFRPPERLAKLPADLAHPHLEFSGLYEDGWVARESKFRLSRPDPARDLVIRGTVPGVDPAFRPELTVLLDGSPVLCRALPAGPFEVRVPAGAATGPRWVELRFDRAVRLPAPDDRTTCAHLGHIGFEPHQPAPPEGTARR